MDQLYLSVHGHLTRSPVAAEKQQAMATSEFCGTADVDLLMQTRDEAEDLKALIYQVMETLVPDEEYSIEIGEVNGQYKFELNTESKRAMIAWAEISFHLEDSLEKEFQEQNIGF